MAPIRTPRHRNHRESQRARSRASLTPAASVILGSHQINLKSRQRYKQRQQKSKRNDKPKINPKKKSSPSLKNAALKVRRELWAQEATGTQHIIFGSGHIVSSSELTVSYPHDVNQDWRTSTTAPSNIVTDISFTSDTTLTVAHRLQSSDQIPSHSSDARSPVTVGVLAFASPKRPGGGWLNGGSEQEEVLARCSSLVASLSTNQASLFYQTHRQFASMDGKGVNDHSMVYSPRVVVFRRDDVEPPRSSFIPPYFINVLSAVPPNAAAIKQTYSITPDTAQVFDDGIRGLLLSRIGRALRIFQTYGDRTIILGAFGCGSNEVPLEMVARVFAELLVTGEQPGSVAAFKGAFEKIVFALPGKQYSKFRQAFELRVFEAELSMAVRESSVTTATFTIKQEPDE